VNAAIWIAIENREQILAILRSHAYLALPIVFAVGLLKSIVLVGVFIPSTAMFVAAAAAYSATGGTFAPLWLAAAAGATAGDALGYAFGRRYRHDVATIWPMSKSPDLLPKGEVLFKRWGIGSVLGAKFVWGIRPFIPVIAGIYRMPFPIFLSATSLSSLVWAGIGMGAGFGLWRLWS
jgi:membrane protein DedA with SNARE-associated domain